MVSLVKKFLRSRRSATAVALAIMTVPLIISAGAAVDFSRIASARMLLQASVDSAALAGAGAWQMSESSSNANNVALAAYNATSAQLPRFVVPGTPSIVLGCTGTTVVTNNLPSQCGGTTAFTGKGNVASGCAVNADGTPDYEYCVVVSATVTMKNSLLAGVIPSELLSATSVARENFPASTVPPPPQKNQDVGSADDFSAIYAGGVPPNANGIGSNFSAASSFNTFCNSITGPGQNEATAAPGAGVTSCNQLFLGDSEGDGGSGSIAVTPGQPIGFTFVNFTGANVGYGPQNAFSDIDVTATTTTIVSGRSVPTSTTANFPNGETITCVTTTNCTSSTGNTSATCSPTQNGCKATVLFGQCPEANLYGALDNGSNDNNGGAPAVDSLNVYSSAEEMLGFPPTHGTNHVLTSFTPNYSPETFKVNGTTYSVVADQCPQAGWPTTIAAGNDQTSIINQNTMITKYATYYPDVTENDGQSSDIFPPQISACTPVTAATAATPNATTSNQWWGWSPSNAANCKITNAFKGTSTSGLQTANNNNCTLLIEPLGTNVPTGSTGSPVLPDYYLLLESSTGVILGMDPVYDGATFTDFVPGTIITHMNGNDNKISINSNGLVVDSDSAGFTPGSTFSYTDTAPGAVPGEVVVAEKPAKNSASVFDHNPPQDTSGKCYNPQANGFNGQTFAGDNNNDTAIDPVANPQLGTVVCDPTAPASYALYWNDMGSPRSDDLGYWNAIVIFTCPSPPTTSGGGAATLSG
jgi:Flp pilus assembly protein TadG